MTRKDATTTSRRRFVKAIAVTGTVAGIGGVASAQDGVEETFRLGGRTSGWQGRAPQSISGTSNPTLDLEAGATYRVVWRNVDGAPHNFAILNEAGEVVQASEIISEGTQRVTFTATPEMTTYYCQVHPQRMRGDLNVGGGGGGGGATTGGPAETTEGTEETTTMAGGGTTEVSTEATTNAETEIDLQEQEGGQPTEATTMAGTEATETTTTQTEVPGGVTPQTATTLPEETPSGVGGPLAPGQPGFGIPAAVAGLAASAAYLLRRSDDEE